MTTLLLTRESGLVQEDITLTPKRVEAMHIQLETDTLKLYDISWCNDNNIKII